MNKSFEEQMEKLEQIVEELEKGNLNLDAFYPNDPSAAVSCRCKRQRH